MNNLEYMNKLSEMLKNNFNITYDYKINNIKFNMFAEFNNRTVKYILDKNNSIYAFQTNEYIFFKTTSQVNEQYLQDIKIFLNENIEKIVNVNNEHMSSIISFIVCGDFLLDKNTEKLIKKFKYYKSFLFGFKGWVNVKLMIINPITREIHTNKFAKGDSKKFLFNYY